MCLVWVTAGVLLNVLVPDWLQTLLLTVLLLFVINKTVRKGITQWRQEQKAIRQKRSLAEHAVRPRHTTSLAPKRPRNYKPAFKLCSSLSASKTDCQSYSHLALCSQICWHAPLKHDAKAQIM